MERRSLQPGRVLARYSIVASRVIGRLEQGFVNENLMVEDAAGARYVLRGYSRVRDPRRLAFQLDFQRHLLRSGVPTAPILGTATGDDAVIDNGTYWVLFAWVEGSAYDFQNAEHPRAAARALAKMHDAGRRFVQPGAPPPVAGQGSYWYRRLETASEQSALLKGLFPEPELREELEFACEWWEAFAREWTSERVEALPRTWLHGDFHGGNVAFAGDELVCLFDFDDVWYGQRVLDVAQGLFNFGRQSRGISGREGRVMRAEAACAFVEAYTSAAPLTQAERVALPSMARAVYPPSGFQLQWFKEHGLDYRARFLRDVEITHQLGDEFDRIEPALAGLLGKEGGR